MSITTTAREEFTMEEHADLARMIFKRFGNDFQAALAAWRRLLENGCPEDAFQNLLDHPGVEAPRAPEEVWIVTSDSYDEYHGGYSVHGFAPTKEGAEKAAKYLQDCAKPCPDCGIVRTYGFDNIKPIEEVI